MHTLYRVGFQNFKADKKGRTIAMAHDSLEKKMSDISAEELKQIHELMVKARVLEERLIKMSKSGEGYFWIGAPGEEAFGVCLGLLGKVGQGIDHDFWHFHYRASPTMLAMGADIIDPLRQMRATANDPYSYGRNFVNHYAVPKWNVVPVSSCIEPQYSQAIGTAQAQRKKGCTGISIVTGGDAGTAEGDFATALVWSSRPAMPLPLLMIVTDNKWGISTSAEGLHGEEHIADRAKPFGIKNKVVDGNNVFESYAELKKAIDYVRKERKPFLLEARVSRLNGHSSASGANRVSNETDCIVEFEKELAKRKVLTTAAAKKVWEKWKDEVNATLKKVREEPFPEPSSIYDHVWADNGGDKGRDTFAEAIGIDYAKDPYKGH